MYSAYLTTLVDSTPSALTKKERQEWIDLSDRSCGVGERLDYHEHRRLKQLTQRMRENV